jgi:hypothetical protein
LFDRAVEAMVKQQDADPEMVTRLQVLAPYVAELLAAHAAVREGQEEGALSMLEGFFRGWRNDPWVDSRVGYQAFNLLKRIATHKPALAPRALELVSKPFAARAANDTRLDVAFELAFELESSLEPGACARALEPFEPWVPFTRPFLERRVRCYERTSDPRLARARQDLESFDAAVTDSERSPGQR